MAMKKIYVFGKKSFTLGFEIAGIRNVKYTDGLSGKEITKILKEVTEKRDAGIIIIEAEEFEKLSQRDKEYFENLKFPIIIPFSEQFKNEILRKKIIQTIGIDLMR
ncbi:MAG TPA: hypothetical protein EYH56_03285 [Nanoarchaeota archaeon]|nr:hypothetical protein [Nanoarchaeota archaeon]